MKKLLITYADGTAAEKMAEYSIPSFKKYVDLHGYDFKLIDKYNDQTPSWQKIYAFQEYLKSYNVVLWIDIDAIIVKFDKDIADALSQSIAFQAIAVEPFQPNTGVWLMKASERSFNFLKNLIEISISFQSGCWEQDAVHYLLGYNSAFCNINYSRNTLLLQEKWNNIHGNVSAEETIIYHFAGRNDQEKIEGLREIAEAGMLIET